MQSDLVCSSIGKMRHILINMFSLCSALDEILVFINNNTSYNNRTSIALKSSVTQAQKRIKIESLINFKSRARTGVVIISLRGRRLFKVEKQF